MPVSDAAAALKNEDEPSATLQVPIEIETQPATTAPTTPDVSDEPSATLQVPVEIETQPATTAPTTPDVSAPATLASLQRIRSLVNRRNLIFGVATAVVVVAGFTIGLCSRSPARVAGASSASAAPSAAPAAQQTAAVPVASVAESAPSAESSASTPPAESAAEVVQEDAKVMMNIKPDGVLVLYKGKVVGRTPFILKQPRGEKRSYEVAKPGYGTRRIVVTGNERSIGFELWLDTPHPDSL